MIYWNVAPYMKKAGIENGNQLAKAAGLTHPIVWRIMQDEPVDRINVSTLEAIASALKVSNPLDLLRAK